MKFRHVKVKNFASYKDLEFNYDNLGLVAITGETGSGKSTLLDIIPWILFGETSKDIKADDIRSWNVDEATEGTLTIETSNGELIIIDRIRGAVYENDLYFTRNQQFDQEIRGKSIIETQQLLNKELGITPELYFTSAYLHQFSKADTFFLSRSSERREVFEKIVDQTQAIQLTDSVSKERKELKQVLELNKNTLSKYDGMLRMLNETLQDAYQSHEKWSVDATDKYQAILNKSEVFQKIKDIKILELSTSIQYHYSKIVNTDAKAAREQAKNDFHDNVYQKNHVLGVIGRLNDQLQSPLCPTCDNVIDEIHVKKELNKNLNLSNIIQNSIDILQKLLPELSKDIILLDKIDSTQKELEALEHQENTYLPQLEHLKTQVNPFTAQIAATELKRRLIEEAANAEQSRQVSDKQRLSLLDLLYDLSFDLRGAILLQAVQEIETKTNEVLNKYFDSEILVKFTLESSDKLELEIQKSGNICSFKQLSGGQRCMLKLAFNLSLMKLAENKAGVKFNTLMLDEPLTGLSDDLKIKAFSLFDSLTNDYDTIMVVEHSDALKACFNNTIVVQLESDQSKISYS